MARAQIFISYRRDDSAGYARAVYDELARHFGAERVFIDVDDIPAGQSFVDVIQRAVGESEVLLVLMGKRWLGEREGGAPRIADPEDFVALEVAAGLAKGMSVIPLLLDGATMPTAAQLPAPLRPLVGRNALELGNTRFAADVERLVRVLGEAIGEPLPGAASSTSTSMAPARATPASRAWRIGAAAAIFIAIAMLAWTLAGPSAAPRPTARAPEVFRIESRPDVSGAWQADVTYDWDRARFVERFSFEGEGGALRGSASFLGVPRGIVEGRIEESSVHFATRTSETGGSGTVEAVHRYVGQVNGDEIRFSMLTEGGASSHVPIEFTARRAASK